MPTLASLVPMVRQRIHSCPDFTIEYWLREVAREFCQRTRYLRETLAVDLVADLAYYPLTPTDAQTEVIGIKAAEIVDGSVPLVPVAPEEVPSEKGQALGYWFSTRGEIVLNPIPNEEEVEALSVNVILQPTKDATDISSEITLRWDRALADGALARLFVQPNKDWSNGQLAGYHEEKFERAVVLARVEADRTHRGHNFNTAPHW